MAENTQQSQTGNRQTESQTTPDADVSVVIELFVSVEYFGNCLFNFKVNQTKNIYLYEFSNYLPESRLV